MKLLLARFVVPVSAPVIEGGGVLIDGERVVAVGPAKDLRRAASPASVEDLEDVALLPGFVNPHTHLELSCYRGALPPMRLWEWLDRLLALRRESGATERESEAVRDGARQSIAEGVTLIGDISRTGLSVGALSDSPIRRVCFIELISGASQPPSTAAELETIVQVAIAAHSNPLMRIGLSPHAPYTVTPNDLRQTLDMASRHGLPLTMHLLETPEEAAWLGGEAGFLAGLLSDRNLANAGFHPKGLRPFLSAWPAMQPPPLFAHVNYADDAAITTIARLGASVVWCPRAHAYFGHTDHPWPRLTDAGINVCVGTDSLASNESLSILDELLHVAARHEDVDASTLIRMGTINGAVALGMGTSAGFIGRDAFADFCAIPVKSSQASRVEREILRSSARPISTWIAGERADMHADA